MDIAMPKAWNELTQEQLRYVYYAMYNFPGVQAYTYIFFRLVALKVVKRIPDFVVAKVGTRLFRHRRVVIPKWQIDWAVSSLEWLHAENDCPMPIDRIGQYRAIDAQWHGLRFENYLIIENYYQGFLQTHNLELIRSAARYLYEPRWLINRGRVPAEDYELFAVVNWIAGMKKRFAIAFPNFFRRVNSAAAGAMPDMTAVMNGQIRALTDGDVTKEERVLDMDCWRALTELDAKAKEYQEMKQKYGNK